MSNWKRIGHEISKWKQIGHKSVQLETYLDTDLFNWEHIRHKSGQLERHWTTKYLIGHESVQLGTLDCKYQIANLLETDWTLISNWECNSCTFRHYNMSVHKQTSETAIKQFKN
jgi:hypothetical protein